MEQATAGMPRNLWIILLAAGDSTRLGTPKQLLRLRGRTLLARSAALATALAGPRVVVVIGAQRARLRMHLRRHAPRARIAVNPHWSAGMGTSLATGVRALPADARAALVILCDQPLIDAHCLLRLIRGGARGGRVIQASSYAGRTGVPALFPRQAFAALRALDADQGARSLLNAAQGRYRIVTVDMPEAALDIDTPADVTALHQT